MGNVSHDDFLISEKLRKRARLFTKIASASLILGIFVAVVLVLFVPLGFLIALMPLIPTSIVATIFTIIATVYDVQSRMKAVGGISSSGAMTVKEKASAIVKISLLVVLVAIIIYTFLVLTADR